MKPSIITLVAVVAVALAGCATRTPAPEDIKALHEAGPVSAAPVTTAGPAKTARGNLVKALGEVAALCADADCNKVAMTFAVDKIEVDPKCTDSYARKYGYDSPPQNGHYVVLHMTVRTTTDFSSDLAPLIGFGGYQFSTIGPDGVTLAGVDGGYGCMDMNDRLPSVGVSPGSQYKGTVVLDSRHTSGTVVFSLPPVTGGWEWAF